MATIAELKAQQAEIQKQIERQLNNERKAVIKQILGMMAEFGIGIEELQKKSAGTSSPSEKKEKAPAKYTLDGVSWSGFGRAPGKIKEYVANGGDLDELLIEKQASLGFDLR